MVISVLTQSETHLGFHDFFSYRSKLKELWTITTVSAWLQHRCQKVVSRGALRLCVGLNVRAGGAWHSNLAKISRIYSVSYFNLRGLRALFGGAKPTKDPRGDGTAWLHKFYKLVSVTYMPARSYISHETFGDWTVDLKQISIIIDKWLNSHLRWLVSHQISSDNNFADTFSR